MNPVVKCTWVFLYVKMKSAILSFETQKMLIYLRLLSLIVEYVGRENHPSHDFSASRNSQMVSGDINLKCKCSQFSEYCCDNVIRPSDRLSVRDMHCANTVQDRPMARMEVE